MDQRRAAEYVTIGGAARRLGIGRRQLDRAVRAGALTVYDIGSWPRLRWSDVVEWIAAQRRATAEPQ